MEKNLIHQRAHLHHSARAGFTLIEILIVISVLGILATVAIPKYADMVRKSKEARTKSNLAALRSAINIYYVQNLAYPVELESLASDNIYMQTIPYAWTAEFGNNAKIINGP